MQQVLQNRRGRAIKFIGLTIFLLAILVFALPTYAATTTSLPTGDGNYDDDWSEVGAPSAWEAVVNNDGNTSYITEDDDDDVRTFAVANAGLPTGAVINSVTFHVVASGTHAGIQLRLEKGTGGSDRNDSATVSLSNSYSSYSRIDTVNPFTHVAWTLAEVNAWTTRFGVQYVDEAPGSDDSDVASVSQVYVVVDFTLPDTTAPVIGTPTHTQVEATGPDGAIATYIVPDATDDVDGTFPANCSPASGIMYPITTTVVICNAMDVAGNAATPVGINVIVRDTTPPAITLIGDDIVLINTGDTYTELGATAADIVDGDVTAGIVIDSSAINNMLPGGYVVTYTSADSHANSTIKTRAVFVSDYSAPVINAITDMTVEATSALNTLVDYGTIT